MIKPKVFNPITTDEILSLQKSRQIYSDCYLTSSLNALSRTDNGRKILQKHIQKNPETNEYKIHFENIYSQAQDIFVSDKEIKSLEFTDRYFNPIDVQPGTVVDVQKAIEIAMNKIIDKNFFMKNLFSRLANSIQTFEFNSPSHFMNIFTGKTPVSLNEKTLRLHLNSKKEEAAKLLKQMHDADGEFNFVAGTSMYSNYPLKNWHCLTVEDVDLNKNKIRLYDTKEKRSEKYTFREICENIKFLTGYFSKDLT